MVGKANKRTHPKIDTRLGKKNNKNSKGAEHGILAANPVFFFFFFFFFFLVTNKTKRKLQCVLPPPPLTYGARWIGRVAECVRLAHDLAECRRRVLGERVG
jgi:hypothetical protein